jgi:hypothetical protein
MEMANVLLEKKAWLKKNQPVDTHKRAEFGCDLRTRMFITGAVGCLERGAELCSVRLSCLSVGPLDRKQEGPTPIKLFCAKVPDGKTGKRYLAQIRGLNWRTCPVISQSLYMFWHFDMRGSRVPFVLPDMRIASKWSTLYLISSCAQNTKQYKAASFGVAMGKLLKLLKIQDETKKKAHLWRYSRAAVSSRCVVFCAAVCCSVLLCAAQCCSVLLCAAQCYSVLRCAAVCFSVRLSAALCCSVLLCAALWCSGVLCAALCCSVLLCAAL